MRAMRGLRASLGAGMLAAFGLSALAGAQGLRPGAAAPELAAGPWVNSAPLTMAELRGRVVLVEFWTYG